MRKEAQFEMSLWVSLSTEPCPWFNLVSIHRACFSISKRFMEDFGCIYFVLHFTLWLYWTPYLDCFFLLSFNNKLVFYMNDSHTNAFESQVGTDCEGPVQSTQTQGEKSHFFSAFCPKSDRFYWKLMFLMELSRACFPLVPIWGLHNWAVGEVSLCKRNSDTF